MDFNCTTFNYGAVALEMWDVYILLTLRISMTQNTCHFAQVRRRLNASRSCVTCMSERSGKWPLKVDRKPNACGHGHTLRHYDTLNLTANQSGRLLKRVPTARAWTALCRNQLCAKPNTQLILAQSSGNINAFIVRVVHEAAMCCPAQSQFLHNTVDILQKYIIHSFYNN